MVPSSASPPQSIRRVGVGIDTSRYGHYPCFLGDDGQPATAELTFAESAAGYQQLRQRLEHIAQRHGPVQFAIRLDAAGQYADNLLHFLHGLGTTPAPDGAGFAVSISCGDPQRNKNYRAALYGNKKSDPIEARACARYALSERPARVKPMSVELRTLRQVAGRLQAVVRQRTRFINQLHHLLALSFPELALLVKNIAVGWVLELLHRYPSAPLLAAASGADLESIPYLPHRHIDALLQQARASIASLTDATVAELVRDQIRQEEETTRTYRSPCKVRNLLTRGWRARSILPRERRPPHRRLQTAPSQPKAPMPKLGSNPLPARQPQLSHPFCLIRLDIEVHLAYFPYPRMDATRFSSAPKKEEGTPTFSFWGDFQLSHPE
jgi:hypothetical protein